jgi:hypothetical protein
MKYLVLLLALFVAGCDTTREDLGFKREETSQITRNVTYRFARGQTMDFIDYDNFSKWADNHKNVRIECITSVNKGPEGSTNGFVVVYSEQ